MKLRLCTYGFAILANVALFPTLAALAQTSGLQDRASADCQDQLKWSQNQLSKFDAVIASWEQDAAKRQDPPRQAIHWAQNRLSELDAAIAVLDQDAAKRKADAHAKAEAALKDLREKRDAFRAMVKDAVDNIITWKNAQAADASKSLSQAADAFQAKVGVYLDAVNADIETRQAVMQAQFPARPFD
ncbi:MAG TPA: hypothetical protein VMT22_16425 [Terriglobales bacterium]|nr:hypothetical protein [Terriglobales bacterium]